MRAGASRRIHGLFLKDAAELWRNPGVVVPALTMAVASVVFSFLVVVAAPMISGEDLGESRDFTDGARQAFAMLPELARLEGAALVQAFLFHQFGVLILMVAVVGSMALAAHAVIGEKISRTLEPLLATPLSTAELLAAKALTPLIFSLVLTWTTLAVYLTGIAVIGEPGVWRTFLGPRTLLLFFVLGPLITLLALLIAVTISSRVNDPRSAQQLGALVVLPITAVFVAQLFGQFLVGSRPLMLAAVVVASLDVLLLWVGTRVFNRERILMRWK